MTTTGNTGVTIWAASDPASIHGASAAQEASLRNLVVGSFADTTARDAAYSAAITAGAVGMRCYIANRAGFCSYVHSNAGTKAWVWEPQQNIIALATRPTAAGVTGFSVPIPIILVAAVTLPPGNRLVRVDAATLAGNTNSFPGGAIGQPRAYVVGTNIPDGESWLLGAPVGGGYQYTLSRSFSKVCSGSVQFQLYGLGAGPSDNVNFSASSLTVIDCGPCDS